jgi:hypothetical protein
VSDFAIEVPVGTYRSEICVAWCTEYIYFLLLINITIPYMQVFTTLRVPSLAGRLR